MLRGPCHFTDGFETADLMEACALLASLEQT